MGKPTGFAKHGPGIFQSAVAAALGTTLFPLKLGIAPPAFWTTFDTLFYQIFEDLSRMRATPREQLMAQIKQLTPDELGRIVDATTAQIIRNFVLGGREQTETADEVAHMNMLIKQVLN